MKKLFFALFFIPSFALAPLASATLIAYEDFNTPAGSNNLDGASGGGSTGFIAPWELITSDDSGDITTPGYNYPSLPTAGNRASVGADASATFYTRSLDTPFAVGANSTGSLYGSFLIQATNTTGSTFSGLALNGFGSITVDSRSILIGQVGANGNYRVADRELDLNGNGFVFTSTTSANTYALIVFKLNIDTTNNAQETISLWINPNLASYNGTEASLGAAAISGSFVDSPNTYSSIESITIGSGAATGDGLAGVDEIRLGTTLDDVLAVPEPSAGILLAVGVALVTIKRRRRV